MGYTVKLVADSGKTTFTDFALSIKQAQKAAFEVMQRADWLGIDRVHLIYCKVTKTEVFQR